jgi:hypothetical protein
MGANWGCERKGDAAATCTVQRAHSFTAVPLAGCGTSLYRVVYYVCPWVHGDGPFMPVCSLPAVRPPATRAAAAQRSAPSEAAGGPHNRQNHLSCITRRRSIRLPRASARVPVRAPVRWAGRDSVLTDNLR